MGADGGINWVLIKNGELGKKEFFKLIEPFQQFYYIEKKSWEHWDREEFDVPDNAFITTYGSFQDSEGIADLIFLLNEIDNDRNVNTNKLSLYDREQLINLNFTFFEVIEDILTRPSWYQDNLLDKALKKADLVNSWNKESHTKYREVLSMTVGDWAHKTSKLINGSFHQYETWT